MFKAFFTQKDEEYDDCKEEMPEGSPCYVEEDKIVCVVCFNANPDYNLD